MGVIDAPQWLLPAFSRSVRALGATAEPERIQASCESLLERWSTPDRRFHNVRHVIDMLARVDELADESHNPDMIRIATWYHGCVFSLTLRDTYRRNGGEDEVASAAEAARDLQALGIPDARVDRICQLILSLKRHNLANDIDAMALNDADLGTLAVNPQLYKSYRELVRAEYEHIPDLDYYRARQEIVTKLLSREKLFASPLGARWELPARENLQSELRRISNKLAELESAAPEAAAPAGLAPTPTPGDGVPLSSEAANTEAFPSPAQPTPEPTVATAVAPTAAADVAAAAVPNVGVAATASALRQSVDAAPTVAVPPAPPVRQVSPGTAGSGVAAAPPPAPASPNRASSPWQALSPEQSTSPAEASPMATPPPLSEQLSSPAATTPEEPLSADKESFRTEKASVPPAPKHTTSMESCAEDIEALLAKPTGSGAPLTRQEQAEAHRAKLCELARAKSEAAKALRETRTASFPAIKDEIVEDGAGQL